LSGFALDAEGNLFVADAGLGIVRKITPRGVASVVAGVGLAGNSGDGGMATSAQIEANDVTVDAARNLYVSGARVIRKVTPSGVITTAFDMPGPIVFDRVGNVFFSDGKIVHKKTPAGVVSTVAGTGIQGFTSDRGTAASMNLGVVSGLAVDPSGALFIADGGNHRIWKVTNDGAMVSIAGVGTSEQITATNIRGQVSIQLLTRGGGGDNSDGLPAVNASLGEPAGIAVDPAGAIVFAETSAYRIRKIDANGLIRTIAGNGTQQCCSGDGGPATAASIGRARKIAIDAAGVLYIMSVNKIRKVTADGIISPVDVPRQIASSAGGNIFHWAGISGLAAIVMGAAISMGRRRKEF
jgi:sugar lactone lactonase YvrE